MIRKVMYAALAATLLTPVPAFAADLEGPEYAAPPAADVGPRATPPTPKHVAKPGSGAANTIAL